MQRAPGEEKRGASAARVREPVKSERAAVLPPGEPGKAPFVRWVGSGYRRAGRSRRIRYKVPGTVAGPPRIDGRPGLAPGPRRTPPTRNATAAATRFRASRAGDVMEHAFPAAALPQPG